MYNVAPAKAGSASPLHFDVLGPAWLRWALASIMKPGQIMLWLLGLVLSRQCTVKSYFARTGIGVGVPDERAGDVHEIAFSGSGSNATGNWCQ